MGKKKRNYRPEEFDEIEEGPSRSQLKREMAELQKICEGAEISRIAVRIPSV